MKELSEALAEKAVMASQKQLHILKTLSSTLASVSRVEPQPSVSALLRALKQLLASSSTDVQLQALGCIKRLLELNAALQSFDDLKTPLLALTSSYSLRIRSASYDVLSLCVPSASAVMDLCLKMQPFTPAGKDLKAFREDASQCICALQWLHRHRGAIQRKSSTRTAALLRKLVAAYDQPRECTPLITDVGPARAPHA